MTPELRAELSRLVAAMTREDMDRFADVVVVGINAIAPLFTVAGDNPRQPQPMTNQNLPHPERIATPAKQLGESLQRVSEIWDGESLLSVYWHYLQDLSEFGPRVKRAQAMYDRDLRIAGCHLAQLHRNNAIVIQSTILSASVGRVLRIPTDTLQPPLKEESESRDGPHHRASDPGDPIDTSGDRTYPDSDEYPPLI